MLHSSILFSSHFCSYHKIVFLADHGLIQDLQTFCAHMDLFWNDCLWMTTWSTAANYFFTSDAQDPMFVADGRIR